MYKFNLNVSRQWYAWSVGWEKKKFHISHWHIKHTSLPPLLLAITPFILYHIFMDMNVQGKNGRQKKSLTKICFYRFYFPLLGMLWNAFIYSSFFCSMLQHNFFICNAHSNDDKKRETEKKVIVSCVEGWKRRSEMKLNFYDAEGKYIFLHTRKWAYPFILFLLKFNHKKLSSSLFMLKKRNYKGIENGWIVLVFDVECNMR